MNAPQFNTELLKNKAVTKYGTIRRLASIIAREQKEEYITVYRIICGRSNPRKKVLNALAGKLDMSFDEVKAVFVRKTTGRKYNPSDYVKVNTERLDELIESSGMSRYKIGCTLGFSSACFNNWKKGSGAYVKDVKRLANLFGVDMSEFVVQTSQNDDAAEAKSNADIKNGSENELVPIGDTLNVHSIFEILNHNILVLGRKLDNLAASQNVVNEEMKGQISSVMIALENIGDAIMSAEEAKQEKVEEKSVATEEETVTETVDSLGELSQSMKELRHGFSDRDDYTTYKGKIYRMIKYIAEKNGNTEKQEMHKYYKMMNRVYGVVYDQLEKDFWDEMHRRNNGSLELLYHNELFRCIFYNKVSDDLADLYKLDESDAVA